MAVNYPRSTQASLTPRLGPNYLDYKWVGYKDGVPTKCIVTCKYHELSRKKGVRRSKDSLCKYQSEGKLKDGLWHYENKGSPHNHTETSGTFFISMAADWSKKPKSTRRRHPATTSSSSSAHDKTNTPRIASTDEFDTIIGADIPEPASSNHGEMQNTDRGGNASNQDDRSVKSIATGGASRLHESNTLVLYESSDIDAIHLIEKDVSTEAMAFSSDENPASGDGRTQGQIQDLKLEDLIYIDLYHARLAPTLKGITTFSLSEKLRMWVNIAAHTKKGKIVTRNAKADFHLFDWSAAHDVIARVVGQLVCYQSQSYLSTDRLLIAKSDMGYIEVGEVIECPVAACFWESGCMLPYRGCSQILIPIPTRKLDNPILASGKQVERGDDMEKFPITAGVGFIIDETTPIFPRASFVSVFLPTAECNRISELT
jgi:hypothetical protein